MLLSKSSTPERIRYMHDYYQTNKQRLSKTQTEYNRTNENYRKWKKDWQKKYDASYQVKARKRQWRQTSEKYKKLVIKWRKKLKDSGYSKSYSAKYYKIHKDEKDKKSKQHYQNHPEIYLKSRIKIFSHDAKKFQLSCYGYKMALMNWAKIIRLHSNSKCAVCQNNADHSHHILHRAKYPELSLNVNNGISLCKQHHYEVHGINLLGGK